MGRIQPDPGRTALVVGLQGRFEEAERIAGQELSPEEGEAVAHARMARL